MQPTDFFIINRGRFGYPLNLRLFLMIEYFTSYITSKQEEWYKDFIVEKDKLRISKLLCCKIMNRMASPSFVAVNLLWAILILSNKFCKILIFSREFLYFFTNFIENKKWLDNIFVLACKSSNFLCIFLKFVFLLYWWQELNQEFFGIRALR